MRSTATYVRDAAIPARGVNALSDVNDPSV
jgi:hypothetical protein